MVPSIEYFNMLIFGRRKAIEVNRFLLKVDSFLKAPNLLVGSLASYSGCLQQHTPKDFSVGFSSAHSGGGLFLALYEWAFLQSGFRSRQRTSS
jgi:hypothetical protein